MKITKIQKGLVLAIASAGVFAAGCELIVDFDRTKIPVEATDATVADVNTADTTTPHVDAGSDADAAVDAGEITDSGNDADADQ